MELLRPVILFALFAGSCTRPSSSSLKAADSRGAPVDSLVVESRTVVFFRQDSLRLVSIKATLQQRLYESLTHDCYFETKFARSVLQRDWPTLAVVNVSADRRLVFKKKDGLSKVIDLSAINDLCGVFLFDGTKDPVRADMPNMESQLWFYFGEGRK